MLTSRHLQQSVFLSKSYKISAHLNYLLLLQQQVLYHTHDIMRHENILFLNVSSCARNSNFFCTKDITITVRMNT